MLAVELAFASCLEDYDFDFDQVTNNVVACPAVSSATHRRSGLRYSVRSFCKIGLSAAGLRSLHNQIRTWFLVHETPFVLRIEDVIEDDEFLYVLTCPLSGRTLLDYTLDRSMQSSDSFVYTHGRSLVPCGREEWCKYIMRQVLQAVHACHMLGLLRRDFEGGKGREGERERESAHGLFCH
jgi:hypothetical protein